MRIKYHGSNAGRLIFFTEGDFENPEYWLLFPHLKFDFETPNLFSLLMPMAVLIKKQTNSLSPAYPVRKKKSEIPLKDTPHIGGNILWYSVQR